MPLKPTLLALGLADCTRDSACVDWPLFVNKAGYGHARALGIQGLAHRLAYTIYVGEIPKGLTLDHLCRNRRCVNPHHLEPVPLAENIARSPNALSTINRRKTHCNRGHPLSGDNLLLQHRKNGRTARVCITCSKIWFATRKITEASRKKRALAHKRRMQKPEYAARVRETKRQSEARRRAKKALHTTHHVVPSEIIAKL